MDLKEKIEASDTVNLKLKYFLIQEIANTLDRQKEARRFKYKDV